MPPSLASPQARGQQQIAELLRRLASEEGVPALAREMIGELDSQLPQLEAKLKAIEARLMAWHRQDQTSQCWQCSLIVWSSWVDASIHVATCTGWTSAIDDTPALAHQARNSSVAR